MGDSSSKTASKTEMNRRYTPVSTDTTNDNDNDPYHRDHQPPSNNARGNLSSRQGRPHKQFSTYNQSIPIVQADDTSNVQKKHQTDQYENRSQPSARYKNNNQTTKRDKVPQNQKRKAKGPGRINKIISEHLEALKISFEKILCEQFASKATHDQHLHIYRHFRNIILRKRPDAQITLYGSFLFECYLNEASTIDIDVQFNETLPYETLKEVLAIIHQSDHCKEADINIDREPMCIDLSIFNSNILVRFTSNYTRAIQLSKMIQIYTKFDERVLALLRLIRSLTKTCNLDQADLGTLHPIVFHLMLIHFLQQLDPPILPCLHEYVFGIDKIPATINNDQYTDFFQICNAYVNEWKSKNPTSIEMLFLQYLCYYVYRFCPRKLIVSIQTRKPLLKNEKQMLNPKLQCHDPTAINRNLCYTMTAISSYKYYQYTLKNALKYFCRRVKHENNNDASNKTNYNNNVDISTAQLIGIINTSYTLFIQQFPKNKDYWKNVQHEGIRRDYRKTFDQIRNPMPEAILKLNENNIPSLPDNDDDQERTEEISAFDVMSKNDNDEEVVERDTIVIHDAINSPNEHHSIEEEQTNLQKTLDAKCCQGNIGEKAILLEELTKNLNENQTDVLHQIYDQQVKIFNNKMQEVLNEIGSRSDSTKESIVSTITTEHNLLFDKVEQTISYSEVFYDMQAKNFGAEKGAPSVCILCFKTSHIRSDCPSLSVPNLIDRPVISQEWFNIVSQICRQITDECRSTAEDIENRERILKYLRNEFVKYYPSCEVHAYGSSHNGFGFRHSDLDICIVLEDNNEESTVTILEKLSRAMGSNSQMFSDIILISAARVPIIRLKHSEYKMAIDISLNNVLAMENTRLLKTYTEINPRVSELGYMIKHLVKTCQIGDASTGTLSSYAYIIMLIHFLQQIQPPVLPVLQQLNDDPSAKNGMIRQVNKWNVYFYDRLEKLKYVWADKNKLTSGELWIEFLRYYTKYFDYEKTVVTIRQFEPLRRFDKGWFKKTIAIEDPFNLTHNLADKLSLKKWTLIRRVLIRARERFSLQPKDIDELSSMEKYLFDINVLCAENSDNPSELTQKSGDNKKQRQISKPVNVKTERKQHVGSSQPSILSSVTSNTSTTNQQNRRKNNGQNAVGSAAK